MKFGLRITCSLLLVALAWWLTPTHLALAADFTVNTINDTVDAAPGNGACADAGNQCSLRAAIMEANALSGADTITLADNTYRLTITGRGEDAAATGDLDITAGGLTIVGTSNSGGAISTIIHGGSLDRVFDLFKDSNVTFRQLLITGGDSQDALTSESAVGQGGGGVRAWEATLTLDKVEIERNRSANHGGGLSFTYNQFGRPKLTTLTINDSIFMHNEAGINGGGLIIGRGATAHISSSYVVSNTAKAASTSGLTRYGGGGLYVGSGYTPIGGDLLNTSVYMTYTSFIDNFASDRKNNQISGSAWGGALHLELSVVSIIWSEFVDNVAEGDFGGAIYSDNAHLTVTDSGFYRNRVLKEGGAISANGVRYTAISGTIFDYNQAVESALGGGGAISGSGQESGGFFSISDSTFTNNSTAGSGGAVRTGSNSTIVNSKFDSNQAGSNGGAIVVQRSSIDAPALFSGLNVRYNRAGVRGGGIHNGDVLYLSDSIIRDNTTVQGEGGGISNYQAYALTITNTEISNNSAKTNGGGLFDSHRTQGSNNIFPRTTRLTDVIVDGNRADGDGGGLYSFSTMQVVNSTISNNRALVSGGGLLTFSNFQFSSERTQFPVNLDLVNVTINGNQATEGGAIYQNGGVSKLNNVTIAGNSASNTRGGGGLYYDQDSVGDVINPNTITLQNTILAQNSATTGPDCANTVLSGGNNLLGNNTDCTFSAASGDQVGTNATPIDPLLSAQALQEGSPAIDSGNNATCAASDQRGAARVGVCDIGAFEFGGIPKQAQIITFAKPADKTLADSPVTLNSTASSNLPVSYSSGTPEICTVSGATVTLIKVGLCTITATQAGDATYKAASPVTQNFNVRATPPKQDQTITFTQPANKTLGDTPFALNATASSELTVSFTGDTPTICTVSGSTVTLVAAGTCTITASQAGNAAFNAAQPVTRSFQVNAPAGNTTKSLYMPLVRRQ